MIRDEVAWNHDRQRAERRRMVIDRDTNEYVQEWSDLDTGEVTFVKRGPLDQAEMHGESARRSK